MPKELHDRLARQARKRGLSGDRMRAYVYGTMHKVESGMRQAVKQKPSSKK